MLPFSFHNGWKDQNTDYCVNTVDETITTAKTLVNFGQGMLPWQPISLHKVATSWSHLYCLCWHFTILQR